MYYTFTGKILLYTHHNIKCCKHWAFCGPQLVDGRFHLPYKEKQKDCIGHQNDQIPYSNTAKTIYIHVKKNVHTVLTVV